jgi:cytochrome c peroxidase
MRNLIVASCAALLAMACDGGAKNEAAPATPEKKAEPAKAEPAKDDTAKAKALLDRAKPLYKPLPDYMAKDGGAKPAAAMIDLGRALYYEKRLSKNHDISCNSCHDLAKFGVDNEPTSPGHKGVRGGRNSPTSLNAALHVAQFWDGRAKDVEEQAGGPVLNPVEMAMPDEATVVSVLKTIPGYGDMFKSAFPGQDDPITYANMTAAIGAFERGLVTPAPFDKFLAGDLKALDDAQLDGLATFLDTGCMACHAGVAVGGQGYFKLGQVVPYETKDEGRKEVTGNDADLHVFKAPSLRNITKTGPYFHDGSIASLDQAVTLMAKHQLGKDLPAEDAKKIVTFLGALEGTLDAAYAKEPALPESGPSTPKPDPT